MADSITSIDLEAQVPRPSTIPSNFSTKPAALPTPINPSRSSTMPLATTPVKRQDNFESLRRNIIGKIKTFLPRDAPPVASPDATNLKPVNNAKTKVDMCIPFINAFNTCVTTGAKFVNSHKTSTLVNWEKSPVCPDVVLERYSAFVAAGVQYIPTVVDFRDMEDQRTRTSFSLHATRRGTALNKFRTLQHYRLVLKEFAKPLQEFTDAKELLSAIADTIQAHHDAFTKAHILHRDISAENIMIHDGRGLLVDWDLSKSIIETDDNGTQLPDRTGTWQFIAYRLVADRKVGERAPVHNKEDDVESFFHVLYWVALRRCEHIQHYQHLQAIMREVYDGSIQVPEHGRTGTQTYSSRFKRQLFESTETISGIEFASPPLHAYLQEFHELVSQRYRIGQKYKDLLILWKNEILEARPEVTDREIILELRGRMLDHKAAPVNFPQHIDPQLLFQSLQPNWAPRLYFSLFGHDGQAVDWATGSSNLHRKELDTPCRRALEKRKSDTSTLDGNDDEGAGHPNKKLRREPGDLSSVHEAEE